MFVPQSSSQETFFTANSATPRVGGQHSYRHSVDLTTPLGMRAFDSPRYPIRHSRGSSYSKRYSTGSTSISPDSQYHPPNQHYPMNKSDPAIGSEKVYPNVINDRHTPRNTMRILDEPRRYEPRMIGSPRYDPTNNRLSHYSSDSRLLAGRLTASPERKHKRVDSNPFDVLYEPEQQSLYKGMMRSVSTNRVRINPAKKEEERPVSSHAPIVTVLGSTTSLRRTGSVVSSQVSLTQSVRRRNKTVYRSKSIKSVLSDDSKTKPMSWRDKFVFLVKRRKSLRYTRLKTSKPNFSTAAELSAFTSQNYTSQVLSEILPSWAWRFQYKRRALPKPKLTRTLHTIKQPRREPKKPEVLPYFGEYTPLKELAYQKYKTAVFANNYKRPPRFQDLYKDESHLLTRAEINQVNKKLLFEILLRRTVSAKISYRLKQNGVPFVNSDVSLTSSDSKSDSGDDDEVIDHKDQPQQDKHPSSGESIDTELIIQQNASLYSGLLPSPQISYASEMFGSIYSNGFNPNIVETETPPPSSPHLSNIDPPKAPTKAPSTMGISKQFELVNELSREYEKRMEIEKQPKLTNSVYSLRPVPRSVATFTTNESANSLVLDKTIGPSGESTIDQGQMHEPKAVPRQSVGSSVTNRHSSATSDSIMQDLDDLSSELSSYLSNTPEPKVVEDETDDEPSKAVIQSLTRSLSFMIKQKGMSRTILESLEAPAREGKIEVMNVGGITEPQRQFADIKSLKGSISGSNASSRPCDQGYECSPRSFRTYRSDVI